MARGVGAMDGKGLSKCKECPTCRTCASEDRRPSPHGARTRAGSNPSANVPQLPVASPSVPPREAPARGRKAAVAGLAARVEPNAELWKLAELCDPNSAVPGLGGGGRAWGLGLDSYQYWPGWIGVGARIEWQSELV